MDWLNRLLGRKPNVAHFTWHSSRGEHTCARCRDLDGTAWVPEADFKAPPLKTDCTCPGGCSCRAIPTGLDEAWGEGNAEFIRKKGGVVTGARMEKFFSG